MNETVYTMISWFIFRPSLQNHLKLTFDKYSFYKSYKGLNGRIKNILISNIMNFTKYQLTNIIALSKLLQTSRNFS